MKSEITPSLLADVRSHMWRAVPCLVVLIALAVPVVGLVLLASNAPSKVDLTPASTLVVQNLHATGAATVDGKMTAKRVMAPPCLGGVLPQGNTNNWSPACLATNTTVVVTAADNTGSVITGIDATSAAVGDWLLVCNTNAPQDDGVVAFTAEDPASLAGNRIWTQEWGRGVGTGGQIQDRSTLGPSVCALLTYLQVDQADPTVKRWVLSQSERFTDAMAKVLELYPYSVAAPITGTVNDYDPDDTCPAVGGPVGGSCEAGGSVASTTYTVMEFQTVDATGAVITGLKYNGSGVANGQGPVKVIYNLGPGPITLVNGCGGSTSAALNQFCFVSGGSNLGDVVVNSNAAVMLWHQRDTGQWQPLTKRDYWFNERDVSMSFGLRLFGAIPGTGDVAIELRNGTGIEIGRDGSHGYILTRGNDHASGFIAAGTDIVFAGGAYADGALSQVCPATVPTTSTGVLSTSSTDCQGVITGAAATTVTLTSTWVPAVGEGANTFIASICTATPISAPSVIVVSRAFSPVFSCFAPSTGLAMVCPDFAYSCRKSRD